MKRRTKKLSESLRRNWASWIAVGIPVVAVLFLAGVFSIHILQTKATVEWIEKKGGRIDVEPSWLSQQIPEETHQWLEKKWGGTVWLFNAVKRVTAANLDKDDLKRLTIFKELKELNLSKSKIGDGGVEILARFTRLEYLEIRSPNLTNAALESIGIFPELRALDLQGCTAITDEGLEHLQGLSGLSKLTLAETSIEPHPTRGPQAA